MDKKTSLRKSLTLNRDGCLVLSFVGILSVTFTTVCLVTLDKICKSKYFRQIERGNRYWQAKKSRPNSSEIFTKVRTSFNEERSIQHWNAQTYGNHFIHWCLTELSVTPPAAFHVVGFLTEWWNTYDVTVNEVLYNSTSCNIERVNGLRKREKIFTVRSVILREIWIVCFPKIWKKPFYHTWEDNIKMHVWFQPRSFGRFYTRHSYAAYNKRSRTEWSLIHPQSKFLMIFYTLWRDVITLKRFCSASGCAGRLG
jgi:hypothetical protein